MVVVLHPDYSVCYPLFGHLVSDHTLDASVSLSEEETLHREAPK